MNLMEHKMKDLLGNYQISPPVESWDKLAARLAHVNTNTDINILNPKRIQWTKIVTKIAAVFILGILSLYSLQLFNSKGNEDLSAVDYDYYTSNILNVKVQESTDDIFEIKNLRLLKKAYNIQ